MMDDELEKDKFEESEDDISNSYEGLGNDIDKEDVDDFIEKLDKVDLDNSYDEEALKNRESDEEILEDGKSEESENNFEKEDIEYDRSFEFDYRGYMSEPKNIEYNNEVEEEENKEEVSSCDDVKKEKKNGVLSTVVISFCVSFFVCCLFVVGAVFGTPYLKEFNNKETEEAFKTYKNITIESTSDELIAEVAEKVGPSVVGIKTTISTRDFFFGLTESNPSGSGSGVVFKENGYILTNNHVIENALETGTNNINDNCKIEVILPSKIDKVYEAKVVGRDPKTDLAVLKIEKKGLSAIEFGDSDKLRVGETAIAIGNPGGLEYMGSVTSGIISGLNRTLALENGRELKLVQTDAAINPGNSGGALVNAKGQLIGINTVKIAGSEYEGLGFAIPSNKVKEICDSLVKFKYVKGRPLIGIMIDLRYTESVAKRNNMPVGVFVASVELLSSAYRAGIKEGDIITEFGDVKVKNISELNKEKDKYKSGDEVRVKIYKSSTRKTKPVKIKLGEDVGTIS